MIFLLVVGIIVGLRLLDQKRLRDAAAINCPVFDTQEYIAGTELADHNLATLLPEGLDIHHSIRYGRWQENVAFSDLVADGFPAPVAVLLKTAQDEQPVFVKPDGFEIAASLSEAKTLIYVEQSGPYHSGSYFCEYRPYVFTLSGEYYMQDETGRYYVGNTVQEGLFRSIEDLGIAEPGSENPLERYVANYQRVRSYDFTAMIKSARKAEDETAIEYKLGIPDEDGWYVIPCFDPIKERWEHGVFEINGKHPLSIMTFEETGWTPIQGTYARIGTAYTQTLLIRVYDCDAGIYVEFPWCGDTSARPQVSGSHIATSPPYVYCPVK